MLSRPMPEQLLYNTSSSTLGYSSSLVLAISPVLTNWWLNAESYHSISSITPCYCDIPRRCQLIVVYLSVVHGSCSDIPPPPSSTPIPSSYLHCSYDSFCERNNHSICRGTPYCFASCCPLTRWLCWGWSCQTLRSVHRSAHGCDELVVCLRHLLQLLVDYFGQGKFAETHPRIHDSRFRLWGATPALAVCQYRHRRMPLPGWIMPWFWR
jgi:hypothetical protein